MKIAELTFDADIFVLAPWRAGRNLACRSAGFLYPSRSAASRVKRNWGSVGHYTEQQTNRLTYGS
jgi:hypothetical protein